MYRVRITVRVRVEDETLEFEHDGLTEAKPFVGMELGEGPGGAFCPLYLSDVRRAAGDSTFFCRAEDDRSHADADAVSAEYAGYGLKLARRGRIDRRAAS